MSVDSLFYSYFKDRGYENTKSFALKPWVASVERRVINSKLDAPHSMLFAVEHLD